jgi:hypothetical protein
MPLDQIEMFALSQLFAVDEIGSASASSGHSLFQVISREKTSSGFYSIIRCSLEGPWINAVTERCWTFDHASLSHRGVFVCWVNDDRTLCLEGFSCSGEWPSELLPTQLGPMPLDPAQLSSEQD